MTSATSQAPAIDNEDSQSLFGHQTASRWVSAGSRLWVASGSVRVQLPPLALEGHGGAGPELQLQCGMGLVLPGTGWVRLKSQHGARLLWREAKPC